MTKFKNYASSERAGQITVHPVPSVQMIAIIQAFVLRVVSVLQIVCEEDVMLPGDVQSAAVREFPLKAEAEGEIRHDLVERAAARVALHAVNAGADTHEDVRCVRANTLVVFVGRAEPEEIELRHNVDVNQQVLPHGILAHRSSACDIFIFFRIA